MRAMDVLLAHRDPHLRDRLRAVLEGAGQLVGELDGPEDAVEACREHDPDVVFLQADGGLEALDAIKHDVEEFTVAVVLVGPAEAVADSTALLRRGAHEVLLEPVRDEDVVPRCAGAIKVRHLQEAVLDLDGTVSAMTHIDPLTGLRNRMFAFEQLTALTNSALRHDRPLSIVAIDIDQVPEVDERYGRLIGDEVVKDVAACLSSRLREEDVAARVDRQDFLVLLPETRGSEAECVAEGLRACVCASPLEVDGEPMPITISAGWAELDRLHPDEFLPQVHAALGRARTGGRNRVCGPLSLGDLLA
jgi:diguanylate cyclase (GGDEF)-like protein